MSLIAHFKFNNNLNNELSGFSNTPTDITYTSAGFLNYSAIFGSASYATFSSTFYLNSNASWTVSVWVKTTQSGTQSILSNSSGGPVYNDLRIVDGKITYYHYNAAWLTKQGTSTINDGKWHNLIWVNFSHNRMNMYVDGVLEAKMVDSTMSSTGAIDRLGRNWAGNNFVGQMDELKIYNDSDLSKITPLNFNKSLVRHWPMLGSLTDYSGNNSTLSNPSGDSTTITTGKIGSALTKTSGYYLSDINNPTDDLTISMWFKHNGTNWLSECLFGTRVGNDGFMFYRNDGDTDGYYRIYFWYNNTSNVVAGYNTWPGISGLSADTWYHITMVRKSNGNLRFYVNGTLSYNGTAPADFSSWHNNGATLAFHAQGNGSGYTAGDLSFNDIRIYNYALSTKQVKLISQAKIVHYPFENLEEEPTINYVSGPTNPDNGWGTRTHTTVSVTDLDIPYTIYGYKMDKNSNASTWSGNAYSYTSIRSHSCTSGNKYTASVWCYVSPECNIEWARISSEGAGNGTSYYDLTKKGTWQRLINTFTASTTGTSNSYLYFSLYGVTTFTNMTGYIIYAAPQFEEKDGATPFTVGTRNNNINDVSGFNYHGAVSSISYSPKWSSDAKLGDYSIYFNGTDPYITTGISSFGGLSSVTISFWRKNDTSITYWLPFMGQTGSHYIMATSSGTGGFYHSGIGSSWEIFKDGVGQGTNVAATPFTDQNWHHYAITGVDLTTWTTLKLNGYTGVWNNEGYFDDVRVYNTVLSDDDIMALYKERGSIDKDGNFYSKGISNKINNAELINQAIIDKTFADGLSSYVQSNCQVTLTDDGYRIYRPANLTVATNGYTMWGGFRATFPDECFVSGHQYIIQFKIKGQTSNDVETYFAYEVGWSTMGIGLSSHSSTKDRSYSGFQSSDYQVVKVSYTADTNRYMYGTWSSIITSGSNVVTYNGKHASAPNVVVGDYLLNNAYFPNYTKITSVTSNVSFTVDNNATSSATANLQTYRAYDTYKQWKFGFTYSDTGTLGTDLYIKDFKIIDITEDKEYNNISIDGQVYFTDIDEVTGTSSSQAAQILKDGTLLINGEISEVD